MKILKKVLIAVIALVALTLLVALFVERDYRVTRTVVIDKPTPEVFAYIKYLKNQDNYSKWANMDPNMQKTYHGADGTVGFVSAWSSTQDDVGKGEQEIKGITEGRQVDYELRFLEPFESTSQAWMATTPAGEGKTNVEWGFDGHMDYPMNLMLLAMDMDEMLGSDLQTGLDNLKAQLER